MKRNIFYQTFLAILLLSAFASCDKVENPYEGIEIEEITEPRRKILILDFTGHNCQNCPGAAVQASEIHEDFPDLVSLVSIHPDISGLTNPLTPDGVLSTDWRTDEGIYYQGIYEVPGQLPIGNVSGLETSNGKVYGPGEWRPVAESLIAQDPMFEIAVGTTYSVSNHSVDVDATVKGLVDLDANVNITVMLTEGDRMDWQKNGTSEESPSDPAYPGGLTSEYIHQHVLRMNMNDPAGDVVAAGVTEGFEETFSFSSDLDADWVAENMEALVIVFDSDTQEMLHVEHADLVDEN